MIRVVALSMVLALGCSAPTDAPPKPTNQRQAIELGLKVGEVHTYTLDWQTSASRDMGSGQLFGGLTLRGELAISALEVSPDGTRVTAWFPRLREGTLRFQGELVELNPRELVDVHAEFVVDATGEIRKAYFAPESAPIFRELMLGVIARFDLRGAAAGNEPRLVRGGHGLIEVLYRRDPQGVITRELAGVRRFDTVPGVEVDPTMLTAEARIELDDRHVPIGIEQHDGVELRELGLIADDRFTLARIGTEPAGVLERIANAVVYDPTAGPDADAVADALDRQFSEGMSITDIEIALDTMDGGVLPRPGFVSHAAAFLRAWPEQIPTLMELTLRADGNGRQLAFDLLSAAGSPAAQVAMTQLLLEPAAASWPERALLVQRFAFVAKPTPESGAFLLAQLQGAQQDNDERMTRAILHPLGTVTGRTQDAVLAEKMHKALTQAAASEHAPIRAAAISGLGNARRAGDLDRLLDALRDPDPDVRVEAAAALRTHVVPAATHALLEALADTDVAVASRALAVLHERHYEGQPEAELIERAKRGEYQPALDRAMASALIGSLEQEGVRAALEAIAGRTVDRELASELAELLGG